MMHQLLNWPDEFDEALWPFAVEHAVCIWNHLVHDGYTLTPIELFTGVRLTTNNTTLHARVWGCPTCVLHPRLQNSKKLPRWTPRSRLGMYLGCSPLHHATVGLILYLKTGHVSPQWHVVYDETFQTVHGGATSEGFDPTTWESLFDLQGEEQNLLPCDLKNSHGNSELAAAEGAYSDFVDEAELLGDEDDPDDVSCGTATTSDSTATE